LGRTAAAPGSGQDGRVGSGLAAPGSGPDGSGLAAP